MDPLTAAIFVGASFLTSAISNRNQAKVEQAQNLVQVEQTKLQAAEAANERARAFRQNISANLALAGKGFGGISGFRGIATRSAADFEQDLTAINQQANFAQISSTADVASTKIRKYANDVGLIS